MCIKLLKLYLGVIVGTSNCLGHSNPFPTYSDPHNIIIIMTIFKEEAPVLP